MDHSTMDAVLHFSTLTWHWPIAIYLFLAGVSAGSVLIALAVKARRASFGLEPFDSGIVRGMTLIAPVSVMLGLGLLIYDLTKPFEFWKMMIYWNPTSVMFWGVIGLSAYVGVLFLYIAVVYHRQLKRLNVFSGIVDLIKRFESILQWSLLLLAVLVGAYTGFLLSALKSYPLLNNPVLPILFLVSGLSSGAASTMLFGLLFFKERADSRDVHFVHTIEKPVLMTEVFLLFAFFLGLYFAGGASADAARNALIGDFWSMVFWVGVVFVGMVMPWLLQWTLPKSLTHKTAFVVSLCMLSLTGVFALRHFILYAGQMVVA